MPFDPRCLDLRHVFLSDVPILTTQKRAAMEREARRRGYRREDIHRAYNRFCRFWVLGQWVEYGCRIRLAHTTPGDTIVVSLRQDED